MSELSHSRDSCDGAGTFISCDRTLGYANRALFAGGELDEEAKDAFYQAVTKAYLSCKMEAKKTFGRKKKNTEMESDS